MAQIVSSLSVMFVDSTLGEKNLSWIGTFRFACEVFEPPSWIQIEYILQLHSLHYGVDYIYVYMSK